MGHTLPPDVSELIEQLKSPDPVDRIRSIQGLSDLDCRDERVRLALEKIAWDDLELDVRSEARYSLGKLGFPVRPPDGFVPMGPADAPAVYGANKPVQGIVRANEESRREKRWLLGLGIPLLLLVFACAGLFLLYLQKSVAEVRAMGPWPATNVEPGDLVNLDLSAFGLAPAQITDARDQLWSSDLSFQKGSYREYLRAKVPIVAIWALRYTDRQTANGDYTAIEAWAKENGGSYRTAYLNNVGIIHLGFSDYYSKVFWNDRWIVVIDAAAGTKYEPQALVDMVRDVMATHWHELASNTP